MRAIARQMCEHPPPGSAQVVGFSGLTAALSYFAPHLIGASRAVRVAGLALLGTGLGASLLLSTLVLTRLALEAC